MPHSDNQWDLKYRPRRFDQVLGNKGVLRLLLKRSASGTLNDQSMMFGGPKGCGKTTLARVVARAIVCSSLQEGEPCGDCSGCLSVLNETSDSVSELDAASQGSVDRVRDMVREADYSTSDGQGQIYIIDEAQRLTAQAQDAFLKAVEERLFIVILCTTEPHKIREPIRSRVEEYSISPPSLDETVAWMQGICKSESVEAEDQALRMVAQILSCCPRACVLALEKLHILGPITVGSTRQFLRFGSFELVDKVLQNLDSNPAQAFAHLDELSAVESPTWIRDSVVAAISSGIRADLGAKPTFPVPTRFFEHRLHGWLDLARILGSLDKPTMPDIEASLLMGTNGNAKRTITFTSTPPFSSPTIAPPAPSVQLPASAPTTAIPASKPVQAAAPQSTPPVAPKLPNPTVSAPTSRSKSVELDGVKFTSQETLTTLDSKISGASGSIPPVTDAGPPPVELDQSHAPIPEKEFIRNLISRVKN